MKQKLLILFSIVMVLITSCGNAATTSVQEDKKETEISETEEKVQKEEPKEEIKNKEFYYLFDDFSLYKASVLSSSTIKVEKWWRGTKGDEFSYEKDMDTIIINDINTDFKWTDNSQTAFTLTMHDEDNPYWDEPSQAYFSIKGYGEDNPESFPEYTFLLNDFSYYKAYAVSDRTIKIEKWYRAQSYEGTPFEHSSDVCVFNTDDNPFGFSWTGEDRVAFTLTMQDQTNTSFWEAPKLVAFTVKGNSIDNTESEYTEYSYLFNDFNLYKAYIISDSTIKIENWYRTNSEEDPFVHSYDVCVINPNDGSTDFAWTDSEHVAFTVTLEDEKAEYWGGLSLCSFTIESK